MVTISFSSFWNFTPFICQFVLIRFPVQFFPAGCAVFTPSLCNVIVKEWIAMTRKWLRRFIPCSSVICFCYDNPCAKFRKRLAGWKVGCLSGKVFRVFCSHSFSRFFKNTSGACTILRFCKQQDMHKNWLWKKRSHSSMPSWLKTRGVQFFPTCRVCSFSPPWPYG